MLWNSLWTAVSVFSASKWTMKAIISEHNFCPWTILFTWRCPFSISIPIHIHNFRSPIADRNNKHRQTNTRTYHFNSDMCYVYCIIVYCISIYPTVTYSCRCRQRQTLASTWIGWQANGLFVVISDLIFKASKLNRKHFPTFIYENAQKFRIFRIRPCQQSSRNKLEKYGKTMYVETNINSFLNCNDIRMQSIRNRFCWHYSFFPLLLLSFSVFLILF